MENKIEEEVEIDLLHLVQVLWRNAFAMILAGIIFGSVAFAGTKAFITPMYDSRAYLYVNSTNLSLGGSKVSISASELTAAKSLIDTYIVILNTRSTLEDVITRSGVSYTYEQLKGMISAASANGTEIFYVDVQSPDPAEARMLANTIAMVLPDKISSIVDGSSVRIVDYAVEATQRTSPSYTKNALIGAVIGVFLVAAFVIIRDLMDEQIHDTDYLIKTYNLPVLAVIPDLLAKQNSSNYYYREEKPSGKK